MASLNNLQIIGNLGDDPEVRFLPSGDAVANARVATNRSWKDDQGEWQSETVWFKVTIWGARGERFSEFARKGDQVFIEGRLKPLEYYTRKDGTVAANLEIVARSAMKLGVRGDSDGDEAPVQRREPRPEQPEMDVDDIPF